MTDVVGVGSCDISVEQIHPKTGNIYRKFQTKKSTSFYVNIDRYDQIATINVPLGLNVINLQLGKKNYRLHSSHMIHGKLTICILSPYRLNVYISKAKSIQLQSLYNFLIQFKKGVDILRMKRVWNSNCNKENIRSNNINNINNNVNINNNNVNINNNKMNNGPILKRRKIEYKSTFKIPSTLSKEQTQVWLAIKKGMNVFFTGEAGTGKSYLLKEIIRSFENKENIYITASTGCAAMNINGSTFFQWTGAYSPHLKTIEDIVKRIKKKYDVLKRWKKTKLLIIDEISMLDANIFDTYEQVAQIIRGNSKPFGGIQLVVCGDFFQLPPVANNNKTPLYCFEGKAWRKCIQCSIILKTIFRQNDTKFIEILNQLRQGICTPENKAFLLNSSNELQTDDELDTTQLLSRKFMVNKINEERLALLKGEKRIFKCSERGTADALRQLDSNCRVPKIITLKIGAQVMLVRNTNVSQNLCNGSRGVVVNFTTNTKKPMPIVKFQNNDEPTIVRPVDFHLYNGTQLLASRSQLPLVLSWAVSIHSSQGMTLSSAVIKLNNIFSYGQAYVALSRLKSLKGLKIVGNFDVSRVMANPKVKAFYQQLVQTK